jgi:hypothetical protein
VDIPKVMAVSMCLGEMSYCLGEMFSKCSLHLVKNYLDLHFPNSHKNKTSSLLCIELIDSTKLRDDSHEEWDTWLPFGS